jgi:hypothetical protein
MDKLICSTLGIVWKVSEDTITIKFENLIIDFRKEFFSDMSFIKYGQPILWQIREQVDGHRYQEFIPTKDEIPNPHLEEVIALLDQIKKRKTK